jgi:hypothetical protein
MFHKAVSVRFLENTTLEVTFQDGIVKQYNMASLFTKYPQLKALEDRNPKAEPLDTLISEHLPRKVSPLP